MAANDMISMGKDALTKKFFKRPLLFIGSALVLIMMIATVLIFGWWRGAVDDNAELNDRIKILEDQLVEERKIDVTYVGNKLESISELTTAKMTYNGIVHYNEENKNFFNKKEFWLSYRVSMKAGFDLDEARITVTEHSVTITLPEAEVYEPVVDETSFQFFEKKYGIFAEEKMEDLTAAITLAKEDALAQPETESMRETAGTQAIALITALFEGQIGDRELIVNIG